MGIRGLTPQRMSIPLAYGLSQKTDPRALELPALTICSDVQFDELGGIQTRKPYLAMETEIYGTADPLNPDPDPGDLADCRRIIRNGNELLVFTKDTLYSWSEQDAKWVSKGTHLAVKVLEEPRFVSPGDQIEADRAELNGTVVYAWNDAGDIWVGAADKETGAVVMPARQVSSSVTGSRPRLLALATKILLFRYKFSTGDLFVYALDPTDPATGLGTIQTVRATACAFNYDVVKVTGADTAVGVSSRNDTLYDIWTVTADLVVTITTKARVAGMLAIASDPTGLKVQVVYNVGLNIRGDLITLAGFVDVAVDQLIGGSTYTVSHIAAAYRSVQDSSQYRCFIFWTGQETVTPPAGAITFLSFVAWADTGGTLGAAVDMPSQLGLVSRAFDHDGSVYVWYVFAEESRFSGGDTAGFHAALQNTYFLYRDDGLLVAKAAASKAGGLTTTGWLANVQAISAGVFTWTGTERRIIDLGGKRQGFSKRAPREITFTFDSNDARRCARLGSTLYISGGEVMQYDGEGLAECGFHIYPYFFLGAEDASGANLANGDYAYKVTWAWENAKGELDRSTTATVGTMTIAAGPSEVDFAITPLYPTHKCSAPSGSRTDVAVEVWRTAVNPTVDAPFYMVTSRDPSDTGDNGYLGNDTTLPGLSFTDDLADADLLDQETNPENGAILEQLAPPPATIIIASADRLFLAGISDDPHRVAYSRLRGDGEVASFHDSLSVNVPRDGGDITALAFLNETLVVFKETAIYALPGDGYDNAGGGQNLGPARLISNDVGAVNHESVALTPLGLIFKSSKGWYQLNRGWAVEYIGGQVSDYDTDEVVSVHVVEAQHQVRCLTTSRMIVLDYLTKPLEGAVGQWAEWTISDGIHAAIWNGAYHYLTDTGPKAEQSTYDEVDYGWDIETAWIPLGQIQGFGRVWKILLLGEYRSAHRIYVRLAKNYLTTYFQEKYWTPSPTTVGGPLQMEHGPSTQEMQAIKIRLTSVSANGVFPPSGEAAKLTSLALELGMEPGLHRLPAAQRQ
jgi:hypothetical protein